MQEKWAHRADLAENALNDRHGSKLWGLPGTNIAMVAWPPTMKEKMHVHWHYWWQAHYLDCLVDAALRRPTQQRRRRIRQTMRAIQFRNLGKLSKNRYYDDKCWLALAMARATQIPGIKEPKQLPGLELDIIAGIDARMGVLPWRRGEAFYNTPTNGPAAIMMARTGRLDQAISLVNWIFSELVNEDGLIIDGQRQRMHGPEFVENIHPYCQGVTLGACLEIALQLRQRAGFSDLDQIRDVADAERMEASMSYIAKIRELIEAVNIHLATPQGVLNTPTGDGDGGLFKGILARYLADIAVRLPLDNPTNRAVKKVAARLVLASAESAWNHRLEVDGLPIFATNWTEDARLPHNFGLGRFSLPESLGVIRIAERDLSVQLSGWMLLEAAARVAAYVDSGMEK